MTEKNTETKFSELIRIVTENNLNADPAILRKAYDFAEVAHFGEKRLRGEDFIFHPIETSIILANWKMDKSTILAGLLHDTVDHGAATREDLLNNFGDEVLKIVEGVSKVSKVKIKGSERDLFIENLRKMFLAMAQDLRIVFIRLAERLDNLRTLSYLPEERRKNYAVDSLEIYSPLAERLGMWMVKIEIDNLAFEYAYPDKYTQIKKLSTSYYLNADKSLDFMKKYLAKIISREKIKVKIQGRKKGYYSLYAKLQRPEINWDISRIHDIIGLRIIALNIKDCYSILGILHKIFKPVPNLPIKDYIAKPKINGYQAIHTNVYDRNNRVVEVKICTQEMFDEAEYGIAAHWHLADLKLKGKLSSRDIDQGKFAAPLNKLLWVKKLAEWQKSIKNNDEFLKAVKFDALAEKIYIFSPKGDVFELPIKSTPVDFAYAVHTDLGEYIKAAKVDGKIVPLNYQFQNGQVVEILKSKEKRMPNHDWLDFVVTTVARRKVNQRLRSK